MNADKHYAKQQELEEARILSTASPHLLPILKKWREDCVKRIISTHYQGEGSFSAIAAELAATEKIIKHIENQQNKIKHITEELYGSTSN